MKAEYMHDKYKNVGMKVEMSIEELVIITTSLQIKLDSEKESLKFYEENDFTEDSEWMKAHRLDKDVVIGKIKGRISDIEKILQEFKA